MRNCSEPSQPDSQPGRPAQRCEHGHQNSTEPKIGTAALLRRVGNGRVDETKLSEGKGKKKKKKQTKEKNKDRLKAAVLVIHAEPCSEGDVKSGASCVGVCVGVCRWLCGCA